MCPGIGDQGGKSEGGTPEGIRTPGLLIRSQALYPAELRVHMQLRCGGGKNHVWRAGVKVFAENSRSAAGSAVDGKNLARGIWHSVMQMMNELSSDFRGVETSQSMQITNF